MKLNLTTKEEAILIDRVRLTALNVTFSRYWVSPDQSHAILATQEVKKWRHSFSAVMLVVNLLDYSIAPLSSNNPTALVSNVAWAPISDDGTYEKIAYVFDSDIYLRFKDISGDLTELRVTTDGSFSVLNGIMSWVYEEEIFSDYSALWWS